MGNPFKAMEEARRQQEEEFLQLGAGAQEKQTISVIDVISEGPISGLVDGKASVFLNSDSIVSTTEAGKTAILGAVTFTNGQKTVSPALNVGIPTEGMFGINNLTAYIQVLNVYGSQAVTATIVGTAGGVDVLRLQTSSSFFLDAMLSEDASISDVREFVQARLQPTSVAAIEVAVKLGLSKRDWILGRLIEKESATSALFSTTGMDRRVFTEIQGTPTLDYTLELDTYHGLTDTTNLLNNWPYSTGSYSYRAAGIINGPSAIAQDIAPVDEKYKGTQVQFRVGDLYQEPFTGEGGSGSTGIVSTVSQDLQLATGVTIPLPGDDGPNETGSQDPKEFLGTAALNTGFGLTAEQVGEVDEIKISFQYPGGFSRINTKGKYKETLAKYKIELALKRNNAFGSFIILDAAKLHTGNFKNAVTWDYIVDISKYKPFQDFKFKISRLTAHNGPGYLPDGTRYDGDQNITSSKISTITSIIKEPLSFPYTAAAKTTFNTKQFSNLPKRSYECRGIMVKVPSNYVTREENGTTQAEYTRNVTTGAIESKYQSWNGAFRPNLVYTNNPAWVYYDIVTNNRYGLGDFVGANDIDKFSLYRIARYCDELVDDGKGGQEPRYTLNTYIIAQADAYKVLKDLATNFLGMLYFLNGKISPVIDKPGNPVYNFSKANVLEGNFSYQTSGQKKRVNQVVVSWTNPDNNYSSEPLLIEDRVNIAETGTLVREDVIAHGCTSEGQATRYGKWKLWTAANQREIVSFGTGQAASFLAPGDLINVQDVDRRGIRYAGRISNTGTLSTSQIPLDSAVTLNANSTYRLTVVSVNPGAYLQEETVNISPTGNAADEIVYNKGDLIPKAFTNVSSTGVIGSSYTYQNLEIEEQAASAFISATATDALVLAWKDHIRAESAKVTTSAGSNITSLTLNTTYDKSTTNGHILSTIPGREDMWSLVETVDVSTLDVNTSSKKYKILSIMEEEGGAFSISAVEHYDSKFAAVEEDFTTYVADRVYPPITPTTQVPACRDFWNEAINYDSQALTISSTIHWTPPISPGKVITTAAGTQQTRTLASTYEFLGGYEISHNLPLSEAYPPSPIIIQDTRQTSLELLGLPTGSHRFALRSINTLGNRSTELILQLNVDNRVLENVNTFPRSIPYGGSTNKQTTINSSGLFSFSLHTYSVQPIQSLASVISNSSNTSSTYQQDCSGMVATSVTGNNANKFITQHYYLLLDSSDASDRIKLLKYHTHNTETYWMDTGDGNDNSNGLTSALTGTVTKAAESATVTGTGTAFTTQFKEGEMFFVGSFSARVSFIQSDTQLVLDRSTTDTFTNETNYFTNNIHIDVQSDCIIGRVYKDTSGNYTLQSYLQYDTSVFESGPTGATGRDAVVITFSNETHTFPVDNTNAISSYANSGTVIEAFVGSTVLQFATETAYNALSSANQNGVFTIQAADISATGITAGTPLADIGSGASMSNASNMTGSTASITIGITGKYPDGTALPSLSKTQTFSKTTAGPTGQTGTTGTQQAYARLYNRLSSAPSAPFPSGGTYTFSSGTVASVSNATGWTNLIPADDGNPVYYTEALAIGAGGSNTSTNTLSWSTPIKFVESGSDGGPGPSGPTGERAPAHFVFDLATVNSLSTSGSAGSYGVVNTNFVSSAFITAWCGTLDAAKAKAIVGLVQNNSLDGSIYPGDTVKLIDTANNNTGTRIYLGSASGSTPGPGRYGPGTSYSSTSTPNFGALSGTAYWSSLVVEKFDGSVIVAGTLSASAIATGSITAAQIDSDTITANEIDTSTLNASMITFSAGSSIQDDGSGNLLIKTGGIDNAVMFDDGVITSAKIGSLTVDKLSGDITTISFFTGSGTRRFGPSAYYSPAHSTPNQQYNSNNSFSNWSSNSNRITDSYGFVWLTNVVCPANSVSTVTHSPTLNSLIQLRTRKDTVAVRVEYIVATSGSTYSVNTATLSESGWTEIQVLNHSTASINGSASTIPVIAAPIVSGSPLTTNKEVTFRISIKMYGDSGGHDVAGNATNEHEDGTAFWRGYTMGLT